MNEGLSLKVVIRGNSDRPKDTQGIFIVDTGEWWTITNPPGSETPLPSESKGSLNPRKMSPPLLSARCTTSASAIESLGLAALTAVDLRQSHRY